MDTCDGSILIRLDMVPTQLERYLVYDPIIPQMGDANGNDLTIHAVVTLFVRFGNYFHCANFLVSNCFAVDVIVGT